MKKHLFTFLLVLINLFFINAQTITLQPDATAGKDAQIVGATGSSTSNFGNNAEFMAFCGTISTVPTTTRGLIQFDLSGIPANSVINSAVLSLYAYNVPGVGGHTVANSSCYIRRITSSWAENTVTWSNQPGITGSYAITLLNATSSTQNYDVNVANLVQEIVNGAVPNYGWMMQLVSESATRTLAFASSDNATATLRPKLVVTYTTCASLPAAAISAVGSTTICSNSNVTLNATPVAAGTYSYQWYFNGVTITGATGTSYVTSTAGSYQCIVKTLATGCSKISNTIAITVVAAPAATITPQTTTTFCTGGNVVLTANAGTGYTYQWKLNNNNIAGATLQNYTATASGNYSVVVTSGNCSATSGNTAVTVHQTLSPTITDDGIWGFCGSTTVQLETQTGNGYAYQWFEESNAIPNGTTTPYQVGHDGTYSVRITNTCGTYTSSPITTTDFQNGGGWPVPLEPYMTILASGSTAICSGMTVFLSVNATTPFFFPSFQWYKDGVAIAGATSSGYSASAPGIYTCSVTDDLSFQWWCGGGVGPTVFSNFITVTSVAGTVPTISINAVGATNFCGAGSVTLNSTVNTSVNYQWLLNGNPISGATSSSYTASGSGSYSCRATNSCSSVTSSSIVVTSQTLNQIISSTTTNICQGSSVTLSATQVPNNTFQWKLNGANIAGATSSTYAATASGTYSCVITNICGTTTAANVLIMTLRPKPTAVISGTQTICSGGIATLSIAFTGSPNWNGYYYNGSNYTNYSTASNPYTFNVSTTTTRTYTLYSGIFNDAYCSGTVSGSAVVTVTGSAIATITPLSATTFCTGGSVQLNANTGTGYTYQWKLNGNIIAGATLASYTANATGNYTVQVTSPCGTATSIATVVTVNTLPLASITATGSTTICSGESVLLKAPNVANRSYQWLKGGTNINGATSFSYTATTGGTYKVVVTNTSTGCSKTTANGTVVTVNALPTASITPQGPTTFCTGGNVTLKANSGAGLSYQWKKNGTNISGASGINYVATTAGTYKVKVTNTNGCTKISGGIPVTVPCRENGESISKTGFIATVHPNPSSDNFTIEVENSSGKSIIVSVFDILGKKITSLSTNEVKDELQIKGLAPGIYSAIVSDGQNTQTLKLVKTE